MLKKKLPFMLKNNKGIFKASPNESSFSDWGKKEKKPSFVEEGSKGSKSNSLNNEKTPLRSTPRSLLGNIKSLNKNVKSSVIKIFSRDAVITSAFIDKYVQIHNGLKLINFFIKENHIGYKFGQFIHTKKRAFVKKKNNKSHLQHASGRVLVKKKK